VCCGTHETRDKLAALDGEKLDLVSRDDPERCQCTHGIWCFRRMQSETLQCDWCWEYRHSESNHKGCEVIRYGYRMTNPRLRDPVRELEFLRAFKTAWQPWFKLASAADLRSPPS
jgi:hypothetical protein